MRILTLAAALAFSPGCFVIGELDKGMELMDEVSGAAKKPAATCHQHLHASFPAAQAASFSLPILALCRISTGKDLWKRTCWIIDVVG